TLAEFFLDLEALERPPAVEEEHFLWCAWTGGARPVTALEKFAGQLGSRPPDLAGSEARGRQ
ncbi:unnamed protein product, partial [Durusdinium trenchii]